MYTMDVHGCVGEGVSGWVFVSACGWGVGVGEGEFVALADPAVRRTGDRRPLPIFFSYFFSAEIRKKNFY